MRSRVLIVPLMVTMTACGYPTFGFVERDAEVDVDVDSAFEAASDAAAEEAETSNGDAPLDAVVDEVPREADATSTCSILSGGDVCSSIPRLAKTPVLDGVGDEYCDVPATKLVVANGVLASKKPAPSDVDSIAYVRAAWTSDALWIHVRVEQSTIVAPAPSDQLYWGDAIELYVSGTNALHGPFDGDTKDPGALHYLIAPGDGTTAPRGITSGAGSVLGSFTSFASRLVTGGYEIEVELLWSQLRGVPTKGATIGFDFGVDVRKSPSITGGPYFQSFLAFLPDSTHAGCPSTIPEGIPACDDLTWCRPTLE